MHNQGKCQEELRHAALLSQFDASAQCRQQGQVLSSGRKRQREGKKRTQVGAQHIPHNHMSPRMHLALRAPSPCEALVLNIPQRCLALLLVQAKRWRKYVEEEQEGKRRRRRDVHQRKKDTRGFFCALVCRHAWDKALRVSSSADEC